MALMLNRKMSRVLYIRCLVITMCIWSAYAQDRESEAREHFQAGQRAEAVGSFAVAAQEYQKVIAILPDTAEAYASLGLVYNAEGKFAESAQALKKCEVLKPGLPGVALYLGIDLVKLKQLEPATRYLKQALRMEPANKQAWLWLSEALLESGQTSEAIDQLRHANFRFPSDPVLLFRLGEVYRTAADAGIEHVILMASGQPLVHQVYGDIYKDEGLWEKAIGHYRRALMQDADWRGAHLGLGEVALRQGKLEDAELEFRHETENDPHSTSAVAELAEVEFYKGMPDSALTLLDLAIQINPTEAVSALGLPLTAFPAMRTNEQELSQLQQCLPDIMKSSASKARSLALAFVNGQLGNTEASATFLKEFQNATLRPGAPHSYNGAGNLDRGDLRSMEVELRKRLQANPNDLQASYKLARTYRNFSLSILSQLSVVAPDSYPAHQLLGETYENAEDYEKAIAEYRLVERMAPDLPNIHFALGHLLLKTGATDQAIAEFNAELQANPNHAGANAELGSVLVEREDQEKGIVYLKRAIDLEPDLWVAHRELGQAYNMRRNFALAEVELQKAVDHDPDGSAHYQLGLVYRALGRPETAKKMFERSREIKEDRLADENAPRTMPVEAARP